MAALASEEVADRQAGLPGADHDDVETGRRVECVSCRLCGGCRWFPGDRVAGQKPALHESMVKSGAGDDSGRDDRRRRRIDHGAERRPPARVCDELHCGGFVPWRARRGPRLRRQASQACRSFRTPHLPSRPSSEGRRDGRPACPRRANDTQARASESPTAPQRMRPDPGQAGPTPRRSSIAVALGGPFPPRKRASAMDACGRVRLFTDPMPGSDRDEDLPSRVRKPANRIVMRSPTRNFVPTRRYTLPLFGNFQIALDVLIRWL